MAISFIRVDDRVIHGQTTTRWTKARPCYGILVVSDNIHADDLRRRVLQAAAGNYPVGIYTVDQAPGRIKKAMESDRNYFLITDSPKYLAELVKKEVDFGSEVNVGPMNTRPGTKNLGRTVAIDDADYDDFEYLTQKGINVSFQLLPSDDKRSWESMKKRYDSM